MTELIIVLLILGVTGIDIWIGITQRARNKKLIALKDRHIEALRKQIRAQNNVKPKQRSGNADKTIKEALKHLTDNIKLPTDGKDVEWPDPEEELKWEN